MEGADGDEIGETEVRALWEKGQLSKLKVAQLKSFMGMKKLTVAGNKNDLVERLEGYFENQ